MPFFGHWRVRSAVTVDDDPQTCPAMLAWLERYGFKGSARRRKIRARARLFGRFCNLSTMISERASND
jgi:hypothetical protein